MAANVRELGKEKLMHRTNSYYAIYRGAPGFVVKHIQPMPIRSSGKPFRAIVFRQGTDDPLAYITSVFSLDSPVYVVQHVSGHRTLVNRFIAAVLTATVNIQKKEFQHD